MTIGRALLQLLVFPGLLYTVPVAWLMLWMERKLTARLQGRIGPPFYQPFFDFVKLLAKQPLPRPRLQALAMSALPVLAVASTLGALALLPVFPHSGGFSGARVVVLGLRHLVGHLKSEARNPKSEGSPKTEIRSPKKGNG